MLAVGRRGRGEGRPFSRAPDLGQGRQMLSIAPQTPSGASSWILRIKGVSPGRGCPGPVEVPFSYPKKPLRPAWGSSQLLLCPGAVSTCRWFGLKTCCLLFGSTLQNHKVSQKANPAMPLPDESLQQGPPALRNVAGALEASRPCFQPCPTTRLPLQTQPLHHASVSYLRAFAHAVPSTRMLFLPLLCQVYFPLSPWIFPGSRVTSSRKPPTCPSPCHEVKGPITYFSLLLSPILAASLHLFV